MKVKETIHKGVDWVDPDTPVTDLANLMRQHDIAAVGSGISAWGLLASRTEASRKGLNATETAFL
jgi:hypothetical protein